MAAIPGISTTGLLSPAGRLSKGTMHPVWRNRSTGKYSTILPTTTGWRLIPDLTVPATGTALAKTDQNLRPTVVTASDGYYVVWASPTASKIQKYTWANVASGAENNVPLTSTNIDQSPMTAVLDSLGQIWVARAQAGVVQVARTADGGVSWTGPAQIGTFGSSQTGVIGLVETNGFMQSLSNGNDSSGRSAKRIALSASDLAQANWVVETLPALAAGAASDDHLAITADSDGAVYAALKTTNGATNVTLIYLLIRSVIGVWTSFNIEVGPDDNGGAAPGYSRPNIILVNGVVYIMYGSIYAPQDLSYKMMSVTAPGAFTARQILIAGPDFSDGALLPGTGEVVSPDTNFPIIVHQRSNSTVDLQWLPTNFPAVGGSMIGAVPVQATMVGTVGSTGAYLGTIQVDA